MKKILAATAAVVLMLTMSGCRGRGFVVRYEEETTTTYEQQGPSAAERQLRALNICRPYIGTPDWQRCLAIYR